MSVQGKFKYKPEVNYSHISAQDSATVIGLLDSFKNSYLKPLEGHFYNANNLVKFLNSESASGEIRAEFRHHEKAIEDKMNEVYRLFTQLQGQFEKRPLEDAAQRIFFQVFDTPEINDAKLDFLKLLKIYEYIKFFNTRVRECWEFVQEIFEKLSVNNSNGSFLEQVFYRIYPRLELCDLTDLLCRRLAYVLKIRKEVLKSDRVIAEGLYTSMLKYQTHVIFQDNLEEIIVHQEISEEQSTSKSLRKEFKDSSIKDDHLLDSRGSEVFNQSYLYILEINKERLAVEKRKVEKAVYIETHIGAEEVALRQDLIRKFISQARKKDRTQEYIEFLTRFSSFCRESLMLNFMTFSEMEKIVLLYHFGPVFFLKIVINFMREGRTGFIHRHLKKNQMARELPFEFIKHSFRAYWDEEVFMKLTKLERNSREMYSNILTTVKKMWRAEQPKVLAMVKNDTQMHRAFNIHDLKSLHKSIEKELSYITLQVYIRFLGPDFVYMSFNNKARDFSD